MHTQYHRLVLMFNTQTLSQLNQDHYRTFLACNIGLGTCMVYLDIVNFFPPLHYISELHFLQPMIVPPAFSFFLLFFSTFKCDVHSSFPFYSFTSFHHFLFFLYCCHTHLFPFSHQSILFIPLCFLLSLHSSHSQLRHFA